MNISQEDAILVKNLYLSKQYGVRRLLGELPVKVWKLGSIDSLLKRIRKTGTIVRLPRSGRPRSAGAYRVYSSGEPCTQSGGQAGKAFLDQLVRFGTKLSFSVQVYRG